MRHVTDGELHAFLDGGLDLLPDDRGEEVRDHISACPVCRERLQDEEQIRSEAKEILGDPAFDRVGLPSFEELRERAEAPGLDEPFPSKDAEKGARYRGPLRGMPLAWAATIVLALGVGWMGGQVSSDFSPAAQLETRGSSYDLVEQSGAQMADLGRESDETEGLQPSRADLAGDSDRNEVPEEAGEQRLGRVVPVASPGIEAGDPESRQVLAESEAAPASLETLPPGSELALSEVVVSADVARRGIDSAAAELVGAPLNPKVTTASRAAPSAMAFSSAGIEESPESLEISFGMVERSDSLENSLAVPGLKVVSIEWEERSAGEKALLIRQLLSPGDTLELRYFGMLLGADSETRALKEMGTAVEEGTSGRAYANVLEASLPSGWNQVEMEWGRGLLVARAPISEANLKALLKYLH